MYIHKGGQHDILIKAYTVKCLFDQVMLYVIIGQINVACHFTYLILIFFIVNSIYSLLLCVNVQYTIQYTACSPHYVCCSSKIIQVRTSVHTYV